MLIIGGGHSGCEIAVSALENQVAKLFICFSGGPGKRNHCVLNRLYPDSEGNLTPYDYQTTRFLCLENPKSFQAKMKSWLYPMDSSATALTFPGDGFAITDTDRLFAAMESHQMEKVGPIGHFESEYVVIQDGTTLENIDYVVMGTGFRPRYPFLNEIWKPDDQIKCELYKHMLHPDVEMDGLAFVMTGPSGLSPTAVIEMQVE